MLQIDIESADLIQRNKRDGSGVYYQQEAYVHTVDRDNNPERYPQKIFLYAPMQNGKQVPFDPGEYHLAPSSLRVERGQLELGFVNLVKVNKAKAA